jgi:hypothetical protein
LSHIVQIQTQVRDETAVAAACRRLNLAAPVRGTFPLFNGEVSGIAVQLPEWRYPIVCDTANGNVQYDNFGGYWGKAEELNRFLQAYAVEKARLEARKAGHSVNEQTLANGSIKLIIQVSGSAA